MLDGPLEAAGIEMIGDHRGEIGGDVEIQTRGFGVRFQLELLAAMDEFLHQHVDRVFALPSPLHDRRDQGSPVLAHEAGCGFLGNNAVGLAVTENRAQVGVVEIRKVFGVEFTAASVVARERAAQFSGFGDAPG